jgi:hypothetical protein
MEFAAATITFVGVEAALNAGQCRISTPLNRLSSPNRYRPVKKKGLRRFVPPQPLSYLNGRKV